MFLQKDKPTVSVIITNHNYHLFLGEALTSITNQTLRPDEVIVIDDSSDYPCKDIIIKFGYSTDDMCVTNHQHPLMARKTGFQQSKMDYICFLDADDKLPPDYLAQAIAILTNDSIDIAYSDLQKFGNENELIKFPKNPKPEILWKTNFLHVGCVVSRDAIIISNTFDKCPDPHDYHEDWMFWRHIVGTGFRYKKQPIPYMSRIHDHNRSKKIRNGTYYQRRAIEHSTFESLEWPKNGTDFSSKRIIVNRCRQSTADYVGVHLFGIDKPQDKRVWKSMAQYMDHNIDAVYDQAKGNILFVGPVIRNTIIREEQIEKWPIKVVTI